MLLLVMVLVGVGVGGRSGFGNVLRDAPIPAVPQGHIRDKHQISLTKAAAPRRRSWHKKGACH